MGLLILNMISIYQVISFRKVFFSVDYQKTTGNLQTRIKPDKTRLVILVSDCAGAKFHFHGVTVFFR